ncbi:uncharacterized protein [Primulina eburnea]|uniref:uncharacterized protein n=1 Tax=Primulina eburnea TaxID=1245227 RepID=UPI003C6C5E73
MPWLSKARVESYDILRVFIDSNNSVNVICKDAFVQMNMQGYHLEAVKTALFGFGGHVVYLEGEIVLPLTLGSQDLKKTVMTSFTVVDSPSSYNIILGKPTMNELRDVASTYHQKIKFSVGARVGEVRGDQPSSRKCYVEAVRVDQSKTRREGEKESKGISPLISEHQLNIPPGSHPVKQKKRHFGPEKDKVLKSTGKWKMCVDFRDLNKACPKDH